MKKTYIFAILIFIFVMAAFWTGCSRNTANNQPPQQSPSQVAAEQTHDPNIVCHDGVCELKIDDKDKVTEKSKGKEKEIDIKNADGTKTRIKQKGDKTEAVVEGKDGKVEYSYGKDVKESDFSVKFYPGAKIDNVNMTSMNSEQGNYNVKTAVLNTSDSPDKVKEYFLKNAKDAKVIDVGEENTTTISSGDPEKLDGFLTINIAKDNNGKTVIIITQNVKK